ncbi:hypothetical protein AB1Y20_000686 [Prymnesium parvum]|uniref:EF-hand domain-containing protein n=1 Tax=Prymnesium parvum TaxID=97485 RepID=A0AB34KAT5_PRYPA
MPVGARKTQARAAFGEKAGGPGLNASSTPRKRVDPDLDVERARSVAKRQMEFADKEEERLIELRTHQPLFLQLADALTKGHVNMRAVELLRSWHGSNEGGITLKEFETNMRSIGLSADHEEIEALFRVLDEDNSGSLGLANLKAGLVKLKEASSAAKLEVEHLAAKVRMLRERASKALSLLDDIAKAEEEEELLERSRLQQPLIVKLGTAINGEAKSTGQRGFQILKSWDSTNTDAVSKVEFRQHVKSLIPDVDYHEIDALFKSLDSDGSGTLEVNEIKPAIKRVLGVAGQALEEFEEKQRIVEESLRHLRERAKESQQACLLFTIEEAAEEEYRQAAIKAREKPLIVRVADIITRKDIKLSTLLSSWDMDKNGSIDLEEFKKNVLMLGIEAFDSEFTALFKLLDSDHSGALEHTEIKCSLRKLHEVVITATSEELRAQHTMNMKMRKTIAAHQALIDTEKAEKEAARKKRETGALAAAKLKVATNEKVTGEEERVKEGADRKQATPRSNKQGKDAAQKKMAAPEKDGSDSRKDAVEKDAARRRELKIEAKEAEARGRRPENDEEEKETTALHRQKLASKVQAERSHDVEGRGAGKLSVTPRRVDKLSATPRAALNGKLGKENSTPRGVVPEKQNRTPRAVLPDRRQGVAGTPRNATPRAVHVPNQKGAAVDKHGTSKFRGWGNAVISAIRETDNPEERDARRTSTARRMVQSLSLRLSGVFPQTGAASQRSDSKRSFSRGGSRGLIRTKSRWSLFFSDHHGMASSVSKTPQEEQGV